MSDISDLFVFGQGNESSSAGDIGLYGIGGSEALVWLSDESRVATVREGRVAKTAANWRKCIRRREFPDIDDRWHAVTVNTCPVELLHHEGTLIVLSLLSDHRIQPEVIQERLSRLFGVGLRSGRHVTWRTDHRDGSTTEQQLHAWDPGPLQDVIEATVTIRKGLSAHVRAGRVDNLSIANSKLSVNYLYRQVKETQAGFGHVVQGAVGYIDLSPQWLPYLTTTKDDITEEGRHLEQLLMKEVSIVLKPLVDQLRQAKLKKVFKNIKFNLKRKFQTAFEELVKASESGTHSPPGPLGPRPSPPHQTRPPQQRRIPLAAEIEVEESSNAQLGGRLSMVEISETDIRAFINIDHHLVIQAMESEPINQRLLEQIIIPALAKEIVEKKALVKLGLFSESAAKALLERYNGNALDVVLYLIRVLTDGVVAA